MLNEGPEQVQEEPPQIEKKTSELLKKRSPQNNLEVCVPRNRATTDDL